MPVERKLLSRLTAPGTRCGRVSAVAAWALLAAAALWIGLAEPGTRSVGPICAFYELTGLTCPGCGATRASHDLLHARVLQAFQHNPLFVVLAPWLLWRMARWTRRLWTGAPPPASAGRPGRLRVWTVWGLVVVVLAFWVLRNIPVAPFTALAP